MRTRNLKLRTKIYGAFAIILLLDMLIGLIATDSLNKVNAEAAAIRDRWLPALAVVGDLMSGIEDYRIIEGRSLLTRDMVERLSSEERLWSARDSLYLLRRDYDKFRPQRDDDDRLIAAFDEAWRGYQNASREMVWHLFEPMDGIERARTVYNEAGEAGFRRTRDCLIAVRDQIADQGRQAADHSRRIYTSTVSSIRFGTVVMILLSWLLGVLLVRGITTPIDTLTQAMRRMAEDDLSVPIETGSRRDEIGVMATALHELHQRLLERRQLIEEEKRNLNRLQSAERELRDSERLAALGRMVAGVSHEINTPLGSAYTVATTLLEEHDAFAVLLEENRIRKSDLVAFVDRVGRASGLISTTLQKASELIRTFKQVAVDRTSSLRRQFTVAEIIHQVVVTTMPLFKHRPVDLNIIVDDAITMDSFPGPLGQVLSNLLQNAVIHGLDGRDGGTVTIEATPLDDTFLTLCVADNGAGILPEHRAHLFEPFFTTRFGQGGSGLGLNIVHAIVTRVLGGSVDVISSPGEGSFFILCLPFVAPQQDEDAAPTVVEPGDVAPISGVS